MGSFLLPQNCLFFLFIFFWCRQPSWHILLNIDTLTSLHCCRFVWLYISEATLQSRFRSGTVDLCFWLLIVEDGELTFCPEPLLHQTRHFCPEACCSLDVFSFFRSLYEMDGCQSLINWQFGRPVRLTWTAILCWKKHWYIPFSSVLMNSLKFSRLSGSRLWA